MLTGNLCPEKVYLTASVQPSTHLMMLLPKLKIDVLSMAVNRLQT